MTELWSGRATQAMDRRFREFSSSLSVDQRLAAYDLRASRVHASALRDAGVLNDEEHDKLVATLVQFEAEVSADRFLDGVDSDEPPEDIHTVIENRLTEELGDLGERLHAGRSRNDQVATATLLWLRDAAGAVKHAVRQVQRALVDRAEQYENLVIPAYTHLQRAQPVLLAHHLLAHFDALQRDVERVEDAARRADRCPLGAAACAGSGIALDRDATAKRLGFARVSLNSLDAVADRDWAIEMVSVCTLIMTHLSRLAEELVQWSTAEFGMARIGDAWTTGSSAMPQKRNPDVAELVRGKVGRVLGDLTAMHMMVKALPLAYNRDLQEDKGSLFDAVYTTIACADALAGALATTEFYEAKPAGPDFMAAMDLAELLVEKGIPFRTAHHEVGALVTKLEADGRGLPEATDEELASVGGGVVSGALLTAKWCIERKLTRGSTAPEEVEYALVAAKAVLE